MTKKEEASCSVEVDVKASEVKVHQNLEAGINEMLKKSNREEKEKFEFLFSIFEKRKRK